MGKQLLKTLNRGSVCSLEIHNVKAAVDSRIQPVHESNG